ncbi:MAG: single-stranded DNA-binding protein, partial [Firmicutes bacterium]|nr:single-stranded DNA-binding protein [Bacillota bacterium]
TTREVELRYTPNGVAVSNFDLAVDRPVKNAKGEKETDFIRIITWQKTAENCANYLKKGRLVAVEGRLQIRSYENKDGQKRWVSEVVASYVQFLEKANQENGQAQPSSTTVSGGGDDLGGIDLNDMPF